MLKFLIIDNGDLKPLEEKRFKLYSVGNNLNLKGLHFFLSKIQTKHMEKKKSFTYLFHTEYSPCKQPGYLPLAKKWQWC